VQRFSDIQVFYHQKFLNAVSPNRKRTDEYSMRMSATYCRTIRGKAVASASSASTSEPRSATCARSLSGMDRSRTFRSCTIIRLDDREDSDSCTSST